MGSEMCIRDRTYTVTVTDANGCTDTDEVDVEVNSLPVPDVSDDITICLGESHTFIVEGVEGGEAPFTYEWSLTLGGAVFSTDDQITVTPTELGTTNYYLKVTDANGCFERDIAMITAEPTPEVTVAPQTICVGETATLVAMASGGNGIFTYQWSANTGDATTASVDVMPIVTTVYLSLIHI